MKLVVIAVIVKRLENDQIVIMTQQRLVQNHNYDPLYDGTWEAVGENVKEGENMIDALIRGIREECGKPDFRPERISMRQEISSMYTTGRGDSILCVEDPLCLVQQMGPPQPWVGPAFLVHVDRDFEPDQTKSDGEAGDHKWWRPKELIQAIHEEPESFMGLHMPALEKAAQLYIMD